MVATVIFAILVSGILGATQILNRSTKVARQKTVLSAFAANELEIVRNLAYSSVGTINGNPTGSLPDLTNFQSIVLEGVTYKVYYEVTYIDDPADGTILAGTDPAPNDYKQVNMYVVDSISNYPNQFVTNVSPKGLEGLTNAGALLIKVFDSNGAPVSGANIHIENLSLTPDVILDRTSDATGNWIEVALPASVNGYEITVTKTGYSTDRTYPITVPNPNPIKPHSTIVNGVVTQITFAIDLVANLTVRAQSTTCSALSNREFNLRSTKTIGTTPTVYKYNQNSTTNGSGVISLTNLEWDTYIPTLVDGLSMIVYGTNPVQSINVPPGSNLTFTTILGPQNASLGSLRVIVKDSGTGLALENAAVHLEKTSPNDEYDAVSGGSVWFQQDWVGGPGQVDYTDVTRYFQNDGHIDTAVLPAGVRLTNLAGVYTSSGWFESSTFDTGSTSNYTTLIWEPSSQNPATSLKFQVASNNDNSTWSFSGPDGTGATYYTISGDQINPMHDGNRYIRYKAFLDTSDSALTPVLSSVAINYVSGCNTPGQVIFSDLALGADYSLDVTLPGYQNYSATGLNVSSNHTLEVLMSP